MVDWTEEQILDEIIALTRWVENSAEHSANDAMLRLDMMEASGRLGRLYQEVGKKLL